MGFIGRMSLHKIRWEDLPTRSIIIQCASPRFIERAKGFAPRGADSSLRFEREPHRGRDSWEGSYTGDSEGGNTTLGAIGTGLIRFHMWLRRGTTTIV